jgi:hypothetical protein
MDKENAAPDPAPLDTGLASRKPYTPPEVRLLGRLSDRTLGVNGSRFDPGHNNNTKFGMG